MKKIIGILFLAVFVIASCRNKEQLGPNLVVNIKESLAVSNSSVNFSTGETIFFTAKFEKDVVWTITITGVNGAKKIFTGIGSVINASNSTWIGTIDVLPSFLVGSVTATLTFQSDPQTQSVPISITGKRISDYPTDALVTDFLVSKRWYNSGPPCNCKYGYTGPNGWPSDYPNIVNTDGAYPKPDGNNYLIMSGTPWKVPVTPYINFLTIMADSSDFQYGKYFPLQTADPAKVYFNLMILGTNIPHAWLQVNIFEEGTSGVVSRTISIKPNWTGWKYLSYKYSDLAVGSTDVANPQKITGVQLVLLSSSPALPGPEVKIGIDHITFTNKAPYQP